MAETIIDKEAYELGRVGCAPPEEIEPGRFFVERLRLVGILNDELFARELLVRVVAKHNEDGFPEVALERLEDNGRPLEVADQEVMLDPDGLIIGMDWDERGYLIGGIPGGSDGFNLTKEQLLKPAAVPVIKAQAQEQEQIPEAA